jgi:hypothetical protein
MPKLDTRWLEKLDYDYGFFSPIAHDSARTLIRNMNSMPLRKKGRYVEQQFNRMIIGEVSGTHHLITEIGTTYKRIDSVLFPKGSPESPSLVFEHTATLSYGKIKSDGVALNTFGSDVHKVIVCGQDQSSKGDKEWARDNNIHIVNIGCNTGLPANADNVTLVTEQINMLKGLVRFFANGSTLRVAA